MDEGHFLNQPYDIRMDKQFKEIYIKRKESGSDNVVQKTQRIIENPTSGSFGGEDQLSNIWTTHAAEYVIGWDTILRDDSGKTSPNASKDDIEELYLWFILHHKIYEDRSSVPLKKPVEVPIQFDVRIYYPADSGAKATADNPMELRSRLYSIYNESDHIHSVETVWDHDQIEDYILMRGKTEQAHIETVRSITPDEAHLSFNNASELEEKT